MHRGPLQLNNESDEEHGVYPRTHQIVVEGSQFLQVEQRLEAFEGELGLPSEPVELEHAARRPVPWRERCDEHQASRRCKRVIAGRVAPMPCLLAHVPARCLGLAGRQRQDDDAGRERFAAGAAVHEHGHVLHFRHAPLSGTPARA